VRAAELLFRGELALRLGHPEYAAAIARRVLEELPGHVTAHGLLGQALLETGLREEASEEFRRVLELDPENVVARGALAVALEGEGQLKGAITQMEMAWESDPANPDLREALAALRAKLEGAEQGPELSVAGLGRFYARKGQHAKALQLLRESLDTRPRRADLLLTQAESLWRVERLEEASRACQSVLSQSPNAVKAKLLLGLISIKRGDIAGGTALLHEAMSADPSGSVASPLLEGTGLTLPDLDDAVEVELPDAPVPPELEAALAAGVSAKSVGARSSAGARLIESLQEVPETDLTPRPAAQELQEALYELSDRMNPCVRRGSIAGRVSINRAPVGLYYLVTNRAALLGKYGEKAYQTIERKLKALQEALTQAGYEARILLVDGVADPQNVVEALEDQIQAGETSGGLESSSHFLLIGGDEIVPFHRLANPTEDDDTLVLSDVPYGGGQHLFLSRRSIGRLPDGGPEDPQFLLSMLDRLIASQSDGRSKNGYAPSLWGFLWRGKGHRVRSFGYTALVWKDTGETLHELIADPRSIQVCPPITEKTVEPGWLDRCRFLLFDLHGTEESPYWYGQKDSSYPLDYPLFPIALGPDNVSMSDLSGAVVFTEASYGANIVGKNAGESLALSFLKRGAACVVGATRLAYGAGEPSLVASDLLARHFWLGLEKGMTAGQSLSRARTRLIQEAQSRQGYVDGDDQKTALEFILLGDPAARLLPLKKGAVGDDGLVAASSVEPQLYCKRRSYQEGGVRVEGEFLARARNHLKRIAPDAWDTQLSVTPRHCCVAGRFFECEGECQHEKVVPTGPYFVTARKSISTQDGATMRRVARITVDDDGRLLKACVSK